VVKKMRGRNPEKEMIFLLKLLKSKRAGIAADPLLTNPLNSDTKLQIGTT
jgi:hypothetical protein